VKPDNVIVAARGRATLLDCGSTRPATPANRAADLAALEAMLHPWASGAAAMPLPG